MSIDLSNAKTIVESLMTDTCRITRNVAGTRNATLDTATGRLTDDAPTTVYEGPFKFKPQYVPQPESEGGQVVAVQRYDCAIPIPADIDGEPHEGDLLEILTALRDPNSVGLKMRIEGGIEYKTFAVQRKFVCELRSRAVDRP